MTGLTCFICLIFMFFELAFGICIGCKVYGWFNKGKVQHFQEEVCKTGDRQEIQKTSKTQLLILIGLAAFVFLLVFLLKDIFSEGPKELMEVLGNKRQLIRNVI